MCGIAWLPSSHAAKNHAQHAVRCCLCCRVEIKYGADCIRAETWLASTALFWMQSNMLVLWHSGLKMSAIGCIESPQSRCIVTIVVARCMWVVGESLHRLEQLSHLVVVHGAHAPATVDPLACRWLLGKHPLPEAHL
jgi:hypothetical protein